MIMSSLLTIFTALTFCCLSARFCKAQSDNTTRDPCESYARCGAFGNCDSQKSPLCSCLPGFKPSKEEEWISGNWSSGCERRVPLNCQLGHSTDGFLVIQKIKIEGFWQRWLGPKTGCEGLCLMNCSCIAYAHVNQLGYCWFWSVSLLNIQIFPGVLATADLYVRVANSELDRKKRFRKVIIIVIMIGSILVFICMWVSWKWMARQRAQKRSIELGKAVATSDSVDSTHLQEALSRFNIEELPLFKFEVLEIATHGFSNANKLGKGGFGPVYKGELMDGREIAVKRLSEASGQGMHEFMNEVVLISKLQHRNLVRLLGCCVENNEKMLVYEYMPNKSLDFFLFDQSQDILDWSKRFKIVEGICRGLLYLHRDSRLKIIHRDLKPSNILLDNDLNPKISDFGMARIFGNRQDHVSTVRVVGTCGYMAPEYAIEGRFSEKSDVFSFGVMMLEIISGRRNTSFHNHQTSLNLLGHVWKLWNEDDIAATIDVRISSPSYRTDVVRCIHIGLLCVQELPQDRPSISAILSMLNSEMVELPEPKQAAFALSWSHSDTIATTSFQQIQKSSSSFNNVTLSIVGGR